MVQIFRASIQLRYSGMSITDRYLLILTYHPQGEALGLSTSCLKYADVIVHIVRGYEDKDTPHYCETVDPVRDVAILNHELMMKVILSLPHQLPNLIISRCAITIFRISLTSIQRSLKWNPRYASR